MERQNIEVTKYRNGKIWNGKYQSGKLSKAKYRTQNTEKGKHRKLESKAPCIKMPTMLHCSCKIPSRIWSSKSS